MNAIATPAVSSMMAVHSFKAIRFMPEQEQEMNISSREFIKKAEFINILSLINGTSDADTPLDTGDNTGDDSGEGGNTGGDDNGGGTDDQGNGDGGIG